MPHKVSLITPSAESHRTAEETLALGYLAATLGAAGYTVQVIDGWLEHLSADEIVARLSVGGTPDLLAFSCYYSNLKQSVEVLKLAKKYHPVPAICGGFGPTFNDELFLRSGFCVAVRGEAEHLIVDLTNAILSHLPLETIPGISYLNNGEIVRTKRVAPEENLDRITYPTRETIVQTIDQKNYVHVCTSRGCNAHCTYCAIHSFAKGCSSGKRWRGRSVENIVEEIDRLIQEHGATHFKFVDDSFLEPPRNEKWAEEFATAILRLGTKIKFRTQVRADRITPAIVDSLVAAGWISTSMGVENFSATALRRMAKSSTREQNLEAIRNLESRGVYVQMGMILFDPDTNLAELEENFRFLQSNPWPITKGIFTEMYAAQGTIFTEQLAQRGLIEYSDSAQGLRYPIIDPDARRAHSMLRTWHRSHSELYDWVTNSHTAPKVMTDEGYRQVYSLYQTLRRLDLEMFRLILDQIATTKDTETDQHLVQTNIEKCNVALTSVREEIAEIYRENNMNYVAIPNPFLT